MTAVEAIGERVRQFNRRQAANRRDTPEACKTGGVYYTPPELVDFIVRSAVGRAARRRGDAIRVLDPACGSGAILVGAYNFLLKRAGRRLTLAQRQTILLEGVFGVDIDPEAVEVAKLALLLKMLEDTAATAGEAAACRRKTLAALAANIKCGNALVGPDFFPMPGGTGSASVRFRTREPPQNTGRASATQLSRYQPEAPARDARTAFPSLALRAGMQQSDRSTGTTRRPASAKSSPTADSTPWSGIRPTSTPSG